MSDKIRMARVVETGNLIRVHEGNESILQRKGIEEVEAKIDSKTNKLVVVGGANYVNLVAASKNLPRIADALRDNEAQREKLLTTALKLPDGEAFLMQQGVYDGKDDKQYIDPKTITVSEETLVVAEDDPEPEPETEGVQDVTAELEKSSKKKVATKKSAKDDELKDL